MNIFHHHQRLQFFYNYFTYGGKNAELFFENLKKLIMVFFFGLIVLCKKGV